jgi:hypothetical protein
MSLTYAESDIARFWDKVDRSGPCWIWTASRQSAGHGQIRVSKRTVQAHRMSYEVSIGPIPEGLVIDHVCRNPPCVNPTHLRAVPQKLNCENRSGAQVNSKSGIRGVRRSPNGRWRAELKHHGKRISVGTFDTTAEAALAVRQARNQIFTHNDADRSAKKEDR